MKQFKSFRFQCREYKRETKSSLGLNFLVMLDLIYRGNKRGGGKEVRSARLMLERGIAWG